MSEELSLHYTPISFFSQKARFFLEEKGVKYKDVFVSLHTGETYEPHYMRINPRGQVPMLKHGDKYIPDSLAIAEYVDKNFAGPTLIPDPSTPVGALCKQLCNTFQAVKIEIISFGFMRNPELQKDPELPFFMLYAMSKSSKGPAANLQQFTDMAERHPDLKQAYLTKREETKARAKNSMSMPDIEAQIKITQIAVDAAEIQLQKNAQAGNANHWLCGPDFLLADLELAILLRRTKLVGAAHVMWTDGKHLQLERYYQRLLKRPSFLKVSINPATRSRLWLYAASLIAGKLKRPVGILLGAALLGVVGYYVYVNNCSK